MIIGGSKLVADALNWKSFQILSKRCNASRCEWNKSVYDHIHTKNINHLKQKQLNDLVSILCNFKLRCNQLFNKTPNSKTIVFGGYSSLFIMGCEVYVSSISKQRLILDALGPTSTTIGFEHWCRTLRPGESSHDVNSTHVEDDEDEGFNDCLMVRLYNIE
jgi:hypothetical protein